MWHVSVHRRLADPNDDSGNWTPAFMHLEDHSVLCVARNCELIDCPLKQQQYREHQQQFTRARYLCMCSNVLTLEARASIFLSSQMR